ncbi:hypothetical protein AQUCO_05300113v1 [Aquilegia coerulea]|uniref:Uncharacterized protein n=1 Tax=Aquilegia coerulea TaxID=218851 RepID=A0A2G5CIF8_AQUCA|nr:hypothetical protein AQUCO_05300113v1 [Aquilegia coerulea]
MPDEWSEDRIITTNLSSAEAPSLLPVPSWFREPLQQMPCPLFVRLLEHILQGCHIPLGKDTRIGSELLNASIGFWRFMLS